MIIKTITYSFLDLIPQAPEAILRNKKMQIQIINLQLYLCQELINIYDIFFIKRDYHNFDPHVGDTACQIRAYITTYEAIKGSAISIKLRISELHILKDKLFKLGENIISGELNIHNNQVSIKNFCLLNDIEAKITTQEYYLFLCFFLTKFKKEDDNKNTYIQHTKIIEEINISRKSAKKLVRCYQQQLAKYSCEIILHLAKYSNDSYDYYPVLKRLIKYDDDNRMVLPCYLYTKVLIETLKQNEIPILMISNVNDETLYMPILFKGQKKKKFLHVENIVAYKNNPAIIIAGEAKRIMEKNNVKDYFHELLTVGLENLILANMASHPQYSGKRLFLYQKNPYHVDAAVESYIRNEFQQYRHFSKKHGCCIEYPYLFAIKHIFCARIGSLLDKLHLSTNLEKKHMSLFRFA